MKIYVTHHTGAIATNEDVIKAVAYMYGETEAEALRELRRGDYTVAQVERCLDYHATEGLPPKMKREAFEKFQAERKA